MFPVVAAVVLVGVARYATPYMFLAAISYLLMVAGILNLKNRKQHAILMSLAISLDLLLVLVLQIQREAVQTAISMKLLPIQQLHILASSMATVFYFPMIYMGVRNYKGRSSEKEKKWHRRLGYLTFSLRTLGFFLMFSMLK